MFDTNHDGKVNHQEMKSMLIRLGIAVPDQTVEQLVQVASKNGMPLSLGIWSNQSVPRSLVHPFTRSPALTYNSANHLSLIEAHLDAE